MTNKTWHACDHIQAVANEAMLLTASFNGRSNCLILERDIPGDFDALAEDMANFFALEDILIFTPNNLLSWERSITELDRYSNNLLQRPDTDKTQNLRMCFEAIQQDVQISAEARQRAKLRLIRKYKRDDDYEPHVDATFSDWGKALSPYNDPTGKWFRNQDIESLDKRTQAVKLKPGTVAQRFTAGDIWRFRCLSETGHSPSPFAHCGERSETPRLLLEVD